jgi:uncharacterized phage-associated protein
MRFQTTISSPPRAFQFSREKLAEAVHYICANINPEQLGNVKLHKILYFSDMFRYLESGQPITGVEYVKQKFGPTARHLTATLKSLEARGVLSVAEEEYFGFRKKLYACRQSYSRTSLSEDETAILDLFMEKVAALSAAEVSEISHDAAWESVPLGEVIPYSSIFRVIAPEIEEADVAWGEETATQYASQV